MSDRISGPTSTARRPAVADVVVVGDGVIGLSAALAVARAGGTSCIVGRGVPGSASTASAGLLAPSVGPAEPAVREVMTRARDRYPEFVHWLAERTGIEVPLDRHGIIELASPTAVGAVERAGHATTIAAGVLRTLEPALAPVGDALLHPGDGFVDNVRLLEAMREAVRCEWGVDAVDGRVARIDFASRQWSVVTEDGRRYTGAALVLAAGAWSPFVHGLPRALNIEPVRGQLLKLRGAPLRHAIAAPDAYLVPRGDCTLVGSTLERVGFDHSTTPPALARLRAAAIALVPELANAPMADAWAGLRPMTPDGLPIIGPDPDVPSMVYACGHGKNGILLAPLTGEIVATLAAGGPPPVDLAPFGVERFGGAAS